MKESKKASQAANQQTKAFLFISHSLLMGLVKLTEVIQFSSSTNYRINPISHFIFIQNIGFEFLLTREEKGLIWIRIGKYLSLTVTKSLQK